MLTLRLYFAQRLTAIIMAPLTLGHLVVMIYAVQDGLSVVEILARTRGSVAWFLFYGSFVLAVAVHAAIGLRVIIYEWLDVRGVALSLLSWAILISLLFLGGRAVWMVTFAGGL